VPPAAVRMPAQMQYKRNRATKLPAGIRRRSPSHRQPPSSAQNAPGRRAQARQRRSAQQQCGERRSRAAVSKHRNVSSYSRQHRIRQQRDAQRMQRVLQFYTACRLFLRPERVTPLKIERRRRMQASATHRAARAGTAARAARFLRAPLVFFLSHFLRPRRQRRV